MFDSKLKSLSGFTTATKPTSSNSFINKSLKASARTTSLGNGAVKYTSTGSDFLDDFGNISNYKSPRNYADISRTMATLWARSPRLAMCMVLYIRLVSRIVQFFSGIKTSKMQIGQGLKHEGVMRMIWVGVNHPTVFQKNLSLFVSCGSWKDIFTMLSYDLCSHDWKGRQLDWNFIGKFILAGLENENTTNLVKKYLPQIKSRSNSKTVQSQARTVIGKWICSLLYGTKVSNSSYKNYRQLKSSGNAHQWQQLISRGDSLNINFDTVAGRALSKLVSSKFLANQGLTSRYEAWIDIKPVAKYTGYVYELFNNSKRDKVNTSTINKQFMTLVEKAGKTLKSSGFIACIDTSGSMGGVSKGTGLSAIHVAKSLALYFSYLLKGDFANHYLWFSNSTEMAEWKGSTPLEKFDSRVRSYDGGTNFQSVANHFVKMLNQGVPLIDFPTGIVCISDGCFNSVGRQTTNVTAFKQEMKAGGFPPSYVNNFKIVFWDVPNSYYGHSQTAFETHGSHDNVFYMSGYDGAGLSFLLGGNPNENIPKNAEELMNIALGQEVMSNIEM